LLPDDHQPFKPPPATANDAQRWRRDKRRF
jgi:hypothetical protein